MINELNKIKKIFDKIYKDSNNKALSVSFNAIDANTTTVVMSNGLDYARLVLKTEKLQALQSIQIAWQDFCKVLDLFENDITYKHSINKITFEEKQTKTKFVCTQTVSDMNDNCNFKFDFKDTDLQLVDMSNCSLLKKQKGSLYDSICLYKNYILSTDGSFGVINKMPNDFGDNTQLLSERLPDGKWYYSPNQRLIVSEDKSIATTIKRSTNSFPHVALLQVSQTPLKLNMQIDTKRFSNALIKCSMIGEHIKITMIDNETIKISCLEYETELKAKNNAPANFSIKLAINYLKFVLNCNQDKNKQVNILFSDNKDLPMIRLELDNTTTFGMGVIN